VSYDCYWMRYQIPDGPDQAERVSDLCDAAEQVGCTPRPERAAGYTAVDVWVPPLADPIAANIAIYMATQEAPTFDAPPLE
jgi:hypothetical protein